MNAKNTTDTQVSECVTAPGMATETPIVSAMGSWRPAISTETPVSIGRGRGKGLLAKLPDDVENKKRLVASAEAATINFVQIPPPPLKKGIYFCSGSEGLLCPENDAQQGGDTIKILSEVFAEMASPKKQIEMQINKLANKFYEQSRSNNNIQNKSEKPKLSGNSESVKGIEEAISHNSESVKGIEEAVSHNSSSSSSSSCSSYKSLESSRSLVKSPKEYADQGSSYHSSQPSERKGLPLANEDKPKMNQSRVSPLYQSALSPTYFGIPGMRFSNIFDKNLPNWLCPELVNVVTADSQCRSESTLSSEAEQRCDSISDITVSSIDSSEPNIFVAESSLKSSFSTYLTRTYRVYSGGAEAVQPRQAITTSAGMKTYMNAEICSLFAKEIVNFTKLQSFSWPALCIDGSFSILIGNRKSGKSLGYAVPLISCILDRISQKKKSNEIGPMMIIVCFSWKKVAQVKSDVEDLLIDKRLNTIVSWGGIGREYEDIMKAALLGNYDIWITTAACVLRMVINCSDDLKISLAKCSYLVFEDVDEASQSDSLTKTIISEWMNSMNTRKINDAKQLVVTGSSWSENINNLYLDLSHELQTRIIISSPLEAAVAVRVKNIIHLVSSNSNLFSLALDGLKESLNQYRTIIFVNSERDGMEVKIFLESIALLSHIITEDEVLTKVKFVIDLWNASSSFILIVCENPLNPLFQEDVRNANIIVHVGLPSTKVLFGRRYSYLMDHFPAVIPQDFPAVSHVILSCEMVETHPYVVKELQRMGTHVPQDLINVADRGLQREKTKMDGKALCHFVKALGKCQIDNCKQRHRIINSDSPEFLPTSGQVEIRILNVVDASRYFASLSVYYDDKMPNDRVDLKSYSDMFNMKLQEYFYVPQNKKSLDYFDIGTFCAVYDKYWLRGKIFSTKSSEVTVHLIDEGLMKRFTRKCIYQLPEELHRMPPLALEVYLCNVRPFDNDNYWSETSTFEMKTFLCKAEKEVFLKGKIEFALNHTLWLSPLKKFSKIGSSLCPDESVRNRLIAGRYGENNPDHMTNLKELCDEEFFGNLKNDVWMNAYKFSILPEEKPAVKVKEARIPPDDFGNQQHYSKPSEEAKLFSDLNTRTNMTNECSDDLNGKVIARLPEMESNNNMRQMVTKANSLNIDYDNETVSADETELEMKNFHHLMNGCENLEYFSIHDEPSGDDSEGKGLMRKGSVLEVEIFEVISPFKFYVMKKDNLERLGKLEEEIEELVKSPSEGELKEHSICLAKFEDGSFYRAEVLSVETSVYRVFFIDYGEERDVQKSQAFCCPPFIYEALEPQAICCRLGNISLTGNIAEATKQMINILKDTCLWMIHVLDIIEVDQTVVYVVDLIDTTRQKLRFLTEEVVDAGVAIHLDRIKVTDVADNESDCLSAVNTESMSIPSFSPSSSEVDLMRAVTFEQENVKETSELKGNPGLNSRKVKEMPELIPIEDELEDSGATCAPSHSGATCAPSHSGATCAPSHSGATCAPSHSIVSATGEVTSRSDDLKAATPDPTMMIVSPLDKVLNATEMEVRPPPLEDIPENYPLQKELHPITIWKQDQSKVYIEFNIPYIKFWNARLSSPTSFRFQAYKDGDASYTFCEELFAPVMSLAEVRIHDLKATVVLNKVKKEEWLRLVCKRRVPWIRADVSAINLTDDDDEREHTAFDGPMAGGKPKCVNRLPSLVGSVTCSDWSSSSGEEDNLATSKFS